MEILNFLVEIILHDDFDQKVKNFHDEMDLHHSYKKKRVLHKQPSLFRTAVYSGFHFPTKYYTKLCNLADPFLRNCIPKIAFQCQTFNLQKNTKKSDKISTSTKGRRHEI